MKRAQNQSIKSKSETHEKIDDDADDKEDTINLTEPAFKDIPISNRTETYIKEIPFIDRSVKPSLNNYNDYSYQEEQVCLKIVDDLFNRK